MILNRIKVFSLLCLTICLFYFSCRQSQKKVNPVAKKLNDSAMEIYYRSSKLFDTPAFKKAISILDKAIAIDSNYYIAYNNKFNLQYRFKQFDNAIVTGKRLLKFSPDSVRAQLTMGVTYERSGDAVSALKYYKTALSLVNKKLDMMDAENKAFKETQTDKALILILLRREKDGHDVLNDLLKKETDVSYQKYLRQLIAMSRHEILCGQDNAVEEDANPVKH